MNVCQRSIPLAPSHELAVKASSSNELLMVVAAVVKGVNSNMPKTEDSC